MQFKGIWINTTSNESQVCYIMTPVEPGEYKCSQGVRHYEYMAISVRDSGEYT
jgi:hypothetical protein